jgi:MFS family permease
MRRPSLRSSAEVTTALTEPTRSVSRLWVAWLSMATIAVCSGFFGPIQVLLAQQAEAISPHHKEATLSLVLGVGAAVSTVLNPLWGAFSDRTVLRIGRRLPWVIGGLVGAVVAMVVLSNAHSVAVMVLGWALAQGTLNAMLAALTATVPDQVPSRQRGAVGGWLAIAQTVGVVAGSGIAALTGSIAAGYLTIAGVLVALSLPYCLDSRDVALDPALREPFEIGPFLRSFWVSPRAHPDFAWAWITRFLMNLGNALVILYLLYYLKDAVDLTDKEAERGVALLTAVYGVCVVLTAVLGGIWSDRLGRRKVFVIASGLVVAGALLLLAFVTTWLGAFIGATVLGVGFGIYTAVDFAMITEVLPSAVDRAKDLGVINIATALPQVLGPAIAAPIVTYLGGYPSLFGLTAAVTVAGAVAVVKIRSVR